MLLDRAQRYTVARETCPDIGARILEFEPLLDHPRPRRGCLITIPTDEIARRRTCAIISHPDAGKTTLTEKLLLFGGAIQLAGEVKACGAAGGCAQIGWRSSTARPRSGRPVERDRALSAVRRDPGLLADRHAARLSRRPQFVRRCPAVVNRGAARPHVDPDQTPPRSGRYSLHGSHIQGRSM